MKTEGVIPAFPPEIVGKRYILKVRASTAQLFDDHVTEGTVTDRSPSGVYVKIQFSSGISTWHTSMNVLVVEEMPAPPKELKKKIHRRELLNWAVSRWEAEVENRPLQNANRRPLDDTWRQVIRFAGEDPDKIIGPSHDELVKQ